MLASINGPLSAASHRPRPAPGSPRTTRGTTFTYPLTAVGHRAELLGGRGGHPASRRPARVCCCRCSREVGGRGALRCVTASGLHERCLGRFRWLGHGSQRSTVPRCGRWRAPRRSSRRSPQVGPRTRSSRHLQLQRDIWSIDIRWPLSEVSVSSCAHASQEPLAGSSHARHRTSRAAISATHSCHAPMLPLQAGGRAHPAPGAIRRSALHGSTDRRRAAVGAAQHAEPARDHGRPEQRPVTAPRQPAQPAAAAYPAAGQGGVKTDASDGRGRRPADAAHDPCSRGTAGRRSSAVQARGRDGWSGPSPEGATALERAIDLCRHGRSSPAAKSAPCPPGTGRELRSSPLPRQCSSGPCPRRSSSGAVASWQAAGWSQPPRPLS